jgi:hypothetical protein
LLDNKMKQSLSYKIVGIAVVVVWILMMAELARRTHYASKGREFAQTEKGIAQGDSEQWMDILLKGKKAGYAVNRVRKVDGRYEVNERIVLIVTLMGSTRRILTSTRAQVDHEFHVTDFTFSLSSEFIDFRVSGRIEGEELFIWMGEEGKGEAKRIRLPAKPMINASVTHYLRSREIAVGSTFSLPLFDPISMTTNPAIIKVVGKEEITINGQAYEAFRLEMNVLGRPLTFWLDERGNSLKEEGFMGFTLVRTTPEKALAGLDSSVRADFYEISSVKVERRLKDPREASYLRVRLDPLPGSLPVDGSRQIAEAGALQVIKERPPFTASYDIPYRGGDAELMSYVMPEAFLQSGDEEVLSIAREIVGGTTKPYKAARMLVEWVFESLEKTPLVSVPDARQILRQRRGDCNEHATLLTALLRAVGIPARMAAGLIYKDGRFYYHAWNEAYLDRWISMDATLNQMPSDATHIKLVDGGIEKQIQIVALIGNLSLTILDYR